jgi:hypothetical protein
MTIYQLNGNTHITDGNYTIQVNATVQEVEENIELYQKKLDNLKGEMNNG